MRYMPIPKHFYPPLDIKLMLLILITFFNAQIVRAEELNIPDIGDTAATALTLNDERMMGEAVVRNIRRAGKLVDDPLLTEYINNLGNKLVSVNDSQHYRFNFFIVDEKSINAFALPGGFIGIHYGLILASRNESELASVLAHEIAHVTQRHHARAYDLGKNYETPVLAALIAAIILGANGNDLGQAALASIAGGTAQIAINFTRRNEKEADRLGIQMLNKAGYDAHSMASFFEQMYNESRLYGSQGPEFLRTHPVTQNRMAEAKSRANLMPLHQPPSSLSYFIAKQRINILNQKDDQELLENYSLELNNKTYINKDATQYGYAISLLKNNKLDKASIIIARLRKHTPSSVAYILTEAQIAEKSNNHKLVNQLYKNALVDYPNNEALIINFVQTLIEQHQFAEAKNILDIFLRDKTSQPVLYKYLSRIESELGNRAATHDALAQYYYSIGQTHQALNQIDLALKIPNLDFYSESRLSARKTQLQAEIKVLANRNL